MDLTVNRILAIDPGDLHCGLAVLLKGQGGYFCRVAHVRNPDDTFAFIEEWLFDLDVVVMEDYRNYPGKPAWGANLTSQLIGRIKALLIEERIPYALQMASIKKPAAGLMRAKGAMLVKPDTDSSLYGHAYDAQRHGWYWVFKHGSGPLGRAITLPRLDSESKPVVG